MAKLADDYVNPEFLAPGNYIETQYPAAFQNDGLGGLKSKPFISEYYQFNPKFQQVLPNFLTPLEKNPKDAEALLQASIMIAKWGQYHRMVPFAERYLAAGGKFNASMRMWYAWGLNRVGRKADALKEFDLCLKEDRNVAVKSAGTFFFEVFLYTWLIERDYPDMVRIFVQAQSYPMSKYERYSMHEDIVELLKRAAINKELQKFLPGSDAIWKYYSYQQVREMVGIARKAGMTPPEALITAADPLFNGGVVPSKVLRERSELAFDNGDADIALQLAQRAMALSATENEDERFDSLVMLSRIHRQREELEQAFDTANQLEKDALASGGKGKLATAYVCQAFVYQRLADFRKAAELFEKSLGLIPDPQGFLLNRRAGALSQTSRATEVEPVLKECAADVLRRHDVNEIHAVHLSWGTCLNNLGRYEEALSALKVVVEPMQQIGDNFKVDASTLISGWIEMGRAYLNLKKYGEAEAAFTAAGDASKKSENKTAWWKWQIGKAKARLGQNDTAGAAQWVDAALENIEAQRASLRDYSQRRTLNDNKYEVYELAVQLALAEHKQDQAFKLAERARARTFLDELGAQSAVAQRVSSAGVTEVQKECRDFTLVAFFQLQQRLLAWVIDEKQNELIEIPLSADETRKASEALMHSIYSESSLLRDRWTESGQAKSQLQASQDLYKKVWAPIETKLSAGSRICIIPHQVLHYVPFQALNDGTKYLIEKHDLFYTPSASSLLLIRQRKPTFDPKIAVFDPLLSLDTHSPFSKTETLSLQQQFPNARFFIREQATVEAFKEHANESGIIHISSHGSFNAWIPLRSALHLSPGVGNKSDALRAEDIYALKFDKTNLVVMSACVSSVGDLAGGDEVTGLTRAFQVAGINNVIGSLWPVENESTTKLMTQFYQELAKNFDDPVAALCKAQRAALDTPSLAKWAAFQVTGDGHRKR